MLFNRLEIGTSETTIFGAVVIDGTELILIIATSSSLEIEVSVLVVVSNVKLDSSVGFV